MGLRSTKKSFFALRKKKNSLRLYSQKKQVVDSTNNYYFIHKLYFIKQWQPKRMVTWQLSKVMTSIKLLQVSTRGRYQHRSSLNGRRIICTNPHMPNFIAKYQFFDEGLCRATCLFHSQIWRLCALFETLECSRKKLYTSHKGLFFES